MAGYTHEDLTRAAGDAIGLFLEYRDVHGYAEEEAKAAALAEVREGTSPATLGDIEEMREWQAAGERGNRETPAQRAERHALGRRWHELRDELRGR